ncbi:MAG: AgmX/PglI C-terminal domain-containing protein [Polyangiaceae bacterium]
MKPRLVVVISATLPLAIWACGDAPKPNTTVASSSASAVVSAPVSSSSANAAASVRWVGPAPSGSSSPEAREAEVMALLSGASSAQTLPVSPTDANRSYDRRLAQMMGLSSFHSSKVDMSEPKIKGPMSVEHARSAAAARPRWQTCFESGQAANPKLNGTLSIKLSVSPEGVVTKAEKAGGSLSSAPVVDCVLRSFHQVAMPTESAASELTFDIKFGE